MNNNYNYKKFERELLTDLIVNNKRNIKNKIIKNREFIETNLGTHGDPRRIENFVSYINNIILNTKNKYKSIKNLLKHDAFENILEAFRNSDILIRACKARNKSVVRWLLTMKINFCVQDENGMTALMYAAEDPKLLFLVKQLIFDEDCLNILDEKGENALFYATSNKLAFKEILETNIDLNHLNNQHETILLYCCKYKYYELIKYLVQKKNIDVNVTDREGKTAAMYLAEYGRYSEIRTLRLQNCNINYVNKNNESALSLLLKNLYKLENASFCSQYFRSITELVELGCDFNIPVDKDGNTAIMIFIIVKDFNSLNYVLRYGKNLDLSIKNKNGDDACSLYFNYPKNCQCKFMIEYPDNTYQNVENTNENIKMMILTTLSKCKKEKLLNDDRSEGNDREIIHYVYSNSNGHHYQHHSNYSDIKVMNLLEQEAEYVYNRKIKKMKLKDHSDSFNIIYFLCIGITMSILA